MTFPTELQIYQDLESHLVASWGSRTKIVFPNTIPSQFSGSYTDEDSFIQVALLYPGAVSFGMDDGPTTPRAQYYILHVNIYSYKERGIATSLGYADELNTIFRGLNIQGNNVCMMFEASKYSLTDRVDEGYAVTTWTCPFTCFLS